MNQRHEPSPLPDSVSLAPELIFTDAWNAREVSALIRSKCDHGKTPAFLFIGRKETALLREHLAEVFGIESVTTLHDTYYMGLEVVEVGCESFFLTGGRKAARTLQGPVSRRPAPRDPETEDLWRFRV
ncbi:hypothetical protein [Luteolibacter marinus]|uniref:hypothetical protein n=1 Tax=Luteolibacter marinus TaxID=2776705 RepID=UPI00186736B3|nr:hypothetical protein [Luteolibacter marinus]